MSMEIKELKEIKPPSKSITTKMLNEIREVKEIVEELADETESDGEPNKVLVTDFETGKKEVVEVDKTPKCMQASKPCLKFIVASGISFVTTTVGIVLLFNPSTTLVTIGASLVSSNLSYWVSPPKIESEN